MVNHIVEIQTEFCWRFKKNFCWNFVQDGLIFVPLRIDWVLMPANSHDKVQQVCEELNNINPVEERLKVVFLVQVFVLHNLKSKQEGYS